MIMSGVNVINFYLFIYFAVDNSNADKSLLKIFRFTDNKKPGVCMIVHPVCLCVALR